MSSELPLPREARHAGEIRGVRLEADFAAISQGDGGQVFVAYNVRFPSHLPFPLVCRLADALAHHLETRRVDADAREKRLRFVDMPEE